MKLTKRQLIQLKRGKEYRSNPPTVFAMFAKSKWKYLYMFLLYVGVSGYFWFNQEYVLSALFGGMLFGILYRDLKWSLVLTRFWPVSAEITNWDRVDELISEHEETET